MTPGAGARPAGRKARDHLRQPIRVPRGRQERHARRSAHLTRNTRQRWLQPTAHAATRRELSRRRGERHLRGRQPRPGRRRIGQPNLRFRPRRRAAPEFRTVTRPPACGASSTGARLHFAAPPTRGRIGSATRRILQPKVPVVEGSRWYLASCDLQHQDPVLSHHETSARTLRQRNWLSCRIPL